MYIYTLTRHVLQFPPRPSSCLAQLSYQPISPSMSLLRVFSIASIIIPMFSRWSLSVENVLDSCFALDRFPERLVTPTAWSEGASDSITYRGGKGGRAITTTTTHTIPGPSQLLPSVNRAKAISQSLDQAGVLFPPINSDFSGPFSATKPLYPCRSLPHIAAWK